MVQGRLFYRWLFYALAALLFLAIQSLFLNRVSLWGVHPFVLPVLVAVASSWEDRQECLCAAAVFGLLCDLWLPGVIPCFYFLSFSLCAFLAGIVSSRWISPGFFCAILNTVFSLVLNGALCALFLTYRGGSSTAAAALLAGKELLLSLPLTVPVYLLFFPIHRRFLAE